MRPTSKTVTSALGAMTCALIAAHLLSQWSKYHWGHNVQMGFEHQLNLDDENNVSTWFSTSMLLACSMLLGVIGWVARRESMRFSGHWLALSVIFLALSIDEASSVHEMTIVVARTLVAWLGWRSSYLSYPWVIFGMALVALFGVAYFRFFLNLSPRTRLWFAVAGLLYVGGAVGAEMVGAHIDHVVGRESMAYAVEVAVEEGFELLGVIVFLRALLGCLSSGSMRAGLHRLLSSYVGAPASR
jgi:hypothetical protein